MLKQFVLLFFIAVNANLNGSEGYFSVFDVGIGRLRHLHISNIPEASVAAVLCDPDKLRLFEAADRLLSVFPDAELDGKCNCSDRGEFTTIRFYKTYISDRYTVGTPWACGGITSKISDIRKACENLRIAGFEFKEESLAGEPYSINITSLDGQNLPKKNLSASERCTIFAAWKKYERVVRSRWNPVKAAWFGAVVRAGHARKPFIATKLEE